MHSPFVKQILNLWSIYNTVIPNHWVDTIKAVSEPGSQSQWRTCFWWRVTRGMEISQDQLLGEGVYAIVERQSLHDGHILALCHATALTAWYRIEIGKFESFTKVLQGPKEIFLDFWQRFASAVNRMIPNLEARQIIIEFQAFKNANSQCKNN